ncbi:MAG: aminotransferase class I/II-fold pyridoxal phosphate-dependent enzyme [Clostridia bacterium]|nr:aminotransferase class I/II-fold pyridoxal phosphate-dependent enzyme [Clostridia bacterium]
MPEGVRYALLDLAQGNGAERYPDPDCRALRACIAAKETLDPGMVLCGNGASELLYRTVRFLQPKTALVVEPTFSEYEKALRETGCDVRKVYAEPAYNEEGALCGQSFALPDLSDALGPDLDLLVLCSPNNPTGRSLSPEELTVLLKVCRANGTLVLWDACFADFMDLEEDPERQARYDQFLPFAVANFEDLLVLKSLTKTYAIPGLRLGYLLWSDTERMRDLASFGPPWSVSAPAQAAGVAALQDNNYLESVRQYVSQEKLRLWLALLDLPCWCRRGDGNFLLLCSERTDLAERLKAHGILVRDCANFDGLDAHWVRFAVKTREENDELLAALRAEL